MVSNTIMLHMDPSRLLDHAQTLKDILDAKVCVQRSHAGVNTRRDYMTYNSPAHLAEAMRSASMQLTLGQMGMNEVIPASVFQKLKLDIDMERCTVDESVVTPKIFLGHLATQLHECSAMVFGEAINPCEWTLYRSHGTEKISYHVTSKVHCVPAVEHAKAFAKALVSRCDILKSCVDMAVYKSVQFFRIANTSKVTGVTRHKCIVPGNWWEPDYDAFPTKLAPPPLTSEDDMCRCLITHTAGMKRIEMLTGFKDTTNGSITRGLALFQNGESNSESLVECIRSMMNYANTRPSDRASHFMAGEFTYIAQPDGQSVRMNRMSPGHCPIHHRRHEKDNCIAHIAPIPAEDVRGSSSKKCARAPLDRDFGVSVRCFRGPRDGFVDLGIVTRKGDLWIVKTHSTAVMLKREQKCSSSAKSDPPPIWEDVLGLGKRRQAAGTSSQKCLKRKRFAFSFE